MLVGLLHANASDALNEVALLESTLKVIADYLPDKDSHSYHNRDNNI